MPPKTSRRSKRKRAAPAEEPPAPAGLDSSSADKATNKKKKKEKPKPRTAATKAASTISSDQMSLLSSLLQKLQALSSNKSQCTDALNALMEGRVACSILNFDPSMMKTAITTAATAAVDGTTTTSNKKKKNEGDNNNNNSGMGDAGLSLAAPFSGDGAMENLSGDPLTDAIGVSKRGGGGGKKDKKKETAAAAAAGLSSLGDGATVDDSVGRNDAHLIMAVTQAINVILSSIKVEGATVFNTATPPPAAAAAAASAASTKNNDNDESSVHSNEEYTSEAIMLAALSSHLIMALMNNRTLFETITKASRGGGSSSHSAISSNNDAASFGMASTLGGSMMDVDEEISSSSRSSPFRGGGGASSSSSASPQKDMKSVIMSHAKAVVGRALTSAVMGSLWSLETLGNNGNIMPPSYSSLQLKDDGSSSSSPEETKAKQSTIRNAMWSSLLALETLFQLTPNPKLLTFSSVTSPFGASASVEDVLSTSSMGSGTNYNSRLWSGHAHSMMGMETIEMWNGILKRIMVGYQLGFTFEGSTSLSSADGGGNNYLSQVCLEVSDSMFTSSESNSKFIAVVMNEFDRVGDSISTSNAPPPGKKARKSAPSRSKKSKQVPEADKVIVELSALLRERSENHVMFDCHVSVRRWAVLAFGWLCKGQKRLLETCVTLLARDDDNSWNEVMALPLFESKSPPEAIETTASKKKKKKKDTKKRPLSTTEGQIEGVPGDLSLLVFVCCMIDMIYDAGSTAGMTPPSTGWMDEYVKSIMASPESVASSAAATASAPSASNKKTSAESPKAPARRSSRSRAATQKIAAEKPAAKGSPRGSKRSPGGGKNVWVRPDIRKETAKLAKYLVEAHTRVLQDTFSEMLRLSSPNASNEMRRLLVNVDPLEGSNEESTIRFYPFLHRTLETLGRAASTNSYFGSSEGKSRVVATGSAVALSCFERNFGRFKADMSSNVVVLDAKLLSFAVNEVYECLGNTTLDKPSQSLEDYSIPDTVLVEYKLNQPLQMDSMNDAASNASGAKSTSSQTFQSSAGRSSAETLAIFIRAHLSSAVASHGHGMDALLRSLFHITRLCYDRMEELDQAISSKSKKNKKKKTSSGGPTKLKYHNVAFLASDVVKTLGSCLSRCDQPKDASTNALLCIRSVFRTFISTELVLDFVNLGDDLLRMIRSSLLNCADQPSDVRWIRLFRAHADLALIMGQGRSGQDCRADVSVIRDSESRLHVYRAIYSERSTPLCLSAFHHALISSTLCSSTSSERADGAAPAEEFLCNSFVNSIEKFLVEFAIPASSSSVIGDGNLISFRDAQLFAMAFGRLPRNDQKKALTKLSGILTKGLKSSKISSLNPDSSTVLTRAATLCASLADIYLVPALLPVLSERMGSSHYDFPSIRSNPKGNFRGIFDWLTPSAPITPQSVGGNQVLEVKLFEKIQAMAEAGIATGFDTFTLDGCHLLLSSWNISTKLTGWNASGWTGVTAASRMEALGVTQKLVALREDMFGVHSLVDVNEDPSVQETLLMRLVRQKSTNCSLREVLPAGLDSAENMLKKVTLQVEKKMSPTLPEFVYFEFLPIYVSFLVSKFTSPGKNAADALDRFHRDNEHDALSDDSCCSDASVTRSNALERLHDACFALGAAPCYPDWLDMGCKMTDGISQNESIDAAKQALKSLTAFGAQVFQRYFGAICKLEDGRTLSGRGNEVSKPSSIALQLIAPCDESILKVVVSNISRANSADVSGCVQRINGVEGFEGWKVNQGERRANGHWEILLLDALAQGSESKAVLDEYSQLGIRGGAREKHDVIKKDIGDVIRWRRILLSVVNALVPTCALLRFSINGKGRKEDPLSLGHSSPPANEESFVSNGINPGFGDEMKESIAFLSLVSAYSANDTSMFQVCTACANQLLREPSQFKRLISLSALRIRCEAIDDVLSEQGSSYTLVDRSLTSDKSQDALLTCFGVKLEKGRVIGFQSDVDFNSDLLSVGGDSSVYGRRHNSWKFIPEVLIRVISSRSLETTTRNHVAGVLIDLMEAKESFPNEVASTLAAALDSLSRNRNAAVNILVEDICLVHKGSQSSEELELSKKIAVFISYLVGVPGTSEGCKSILKEMLSKFDQWANSAPKHSIKLICLLASRFGSLNDVGKTIVSLLQKATDQSELSGYVDCVRDFFAFVVSLDEMIKPAVLGVSSPFRGSGKMKQMVDNKGTSLLRSKGEEVAETRTCSFVETGEGFTEQHWYNCYTCGLLWDKGCCSLCARVCHQGHDVGYSRKSSFFCDCGAEVATAVEENRTPCKCLVPVNDETLKAVFAKADVTDGGAAKEESTEDSVMSHDLFIEFLVANFKSSCKQSLESLTEAAKDSNWADAIISMLGSFYSDEHNSQVNDYKELLLGSSSSSTNANSSVIDVESRSGLPLKLKTQSKTSMVPLRAAKSNTVQPKVFSSGSSSSQIRKSRADRSAQLIVSDDRGRLFIAESTSVLFCLAPVNVRHIQRSAISSHLTRSKLNILGSDKVKFAINGMSLSPENKRHLLIWGASKAAVAIVSKGLDSFERVIELKMQSEPAECDSDSEYLLRCDWVSHSELMVVVVCGTVVHVFDLRREKDNSCDATTHYALAYEDVLIRSATLLERLPRIGSGVEYDDPIIETKLALLLDTGRLYFIDLIVDEEGNLEDQGENYIEIGAGVSFPTAGIRRYQGAEPATEGSTSTTLGEGAHLSYLRHSNLLLYQCMSSCVVALILDDDGSIIANFEILPNMIPAADLGGSYAVVGPYHHFEELGIVERGGESFYRFSCIGKSTRTSSQPILILVEFNKSDIFVRELDWPTVTGLGIMSSYSYVGSCAYSCPHLVGGRSASDGYIDAGTTIKERACLTLLTSSGSILTFGEDYAATTSTSLTRSQWSSSIQRSPDIHIFERLINVSEIDQLVLGGDCVGKNHKTAKSKLSLNSTEYLACPSREGCTLTAALQPKAGQKETEDLAIVAIRVLVGTMPDLIPSEVAIVGSGRSIKLKRNVKRWYDFPLTDEEILMAVRNGFVSIWISSCYDGNSSVIDCLEVYARTREELSFLTAAGQSGGKAKELSCQQSVKSLAAQSFRRELVPCFQSLTSLVKIVSGSDDALKSTSPNLDQASSIVKSVLELTPLDQSCEERKEALTLLSEAERDAMRRTNVEDESTVRGLLVQLQHLEKFFRAEYENEDEIKPQQDVIIERGMSMLLLIMNSTMKIVQRRGHNYRKIITKLIEEKSCESSIALISKGIIDFVQTLEATHGAQPKLSSSVALNSKLILMEMACSNSDDFAQFKVIEQYFSLDSEIVKSCCAAMRSTITGGDNNDTSKVIAPPSPEKEFTSEGYVTYQCDACTTFPITGTRYTLGGEMDIDLCKQCYDKGIAYARTHDLNEAVEIDGRTLSIRGEDGDNEDMTCAKVWQMGVRVIETSTLEQAEEAKRAGFLNNMASQKANVTSSQNTDVTSSSKQGEEIDVVSTEGFASSVFTHILLFLSNTLANQSEPPSMYVLQLAVDLVLNAKTEELKASRGKEMVGALTKHLKSLIEGCSIDAELPRDTCTKIVMSLRSLTSLVLARRDIMSRKFPLETKGKSNSRQKDKTDPRFICDVHGVPAVRRRCSHGVHKDRRFYVCGLERKHRCAYFKWSDDTTQSSTQNNDGLPLSLPVVQELQNVFAECKLESSFCGLISAQYHSQGDSIVNESHSDHIDPFPSLTMEEDRLRDKADGVLLVPEKLGRALPSSRSEDEFLDVANGTTELLVCESMDLFSYIAPKRKSSDSLVWSKGWFSILCEIISGDSGTTLRALAKKMLQRLCGFRNDIYHKVRDHYVFGFQYSKLLLQSCEILDAALLVREQARQCGRNWRDEEVTFQSLPASGLFGTEDLISEDCMKREESISSVLDELLSHARRGENWKNFCGGLPEVNNLKRGSTDVSDFMLDMLQEIFTRPPIVSLMWLGSCLGGSNQVKVFSLVDVALENAGSKSVSISTNDTEELMLYIGGDSNRPTPEQSLTRCMKIDDVNAFICQFVLSGPSDKLRSIASAIGIKLALQFNSSDRNRLFKSLIDSGMQKIGSLGQESKDFTDVLKLFIEEFGLDLDLHHAASSFSQAFKMQMTSLNCYCEKNCSPNRDESDISRLHFDLSDCEYCHKEQLWTRLTSQDKLSSDDASDMKFLSQQMRPYQRGRLETSTASTCFSEFSSYYQLKFRVALSQVHINISDPRGRLAKTISVYFTPRQVSSGSSSDEDNVNILKSDSYSRFWQKCGTINLSRGATEASLELKHPVVAANLKITFEDFYERNNNVKSNSDGPVLYCPRCTRQVTNAHGVCGHCGEVAFQCRKCRHINYDRLDAFLCVECGYCTSGGFHFELTAGIAVNAVAIVDEEQFQTSMALLRVANKRKTDTTKKLTALLQKHRNQDDELNELSLYGPHLKRALTGSLPKSFVDDKPEVSTSSKPIRSSTSTNRSRLLSLARSLRQDGDSLGGSRGEFLRQALLGSSGPGGGDDYMDDALLNALGGGSGSSSDPLSRLVANIRSGDGEDAAEKAEKKAKLSPAEECRRLYMQKREAERESWELNRRIDSWNRLNSDTLAAKMCNHGGTYMTTDCSVCCSKVAYKNLSLLHAVFQANISQSEHSVSSELVKLLLQESADLDPALKDLKRQVIITVASKSESASGLVLNELKLRLRAIQDRTSAQILGELVQMDFKGVDKFIELAVSVLEG